MIERIKEKYKELFQSAYEWILDGWEYAGGENGISPLMVAAALEKEAVTQDHCVADGDSHASYPIHLRRLAALIAKTEASRLIAECPTEDGTMDFDEVITHIEARLYHTSGETLACFFNEICGDLTPIHYNGDSLFEEGYGPLAED